MDGIGCRGYSLCGCWGEGRGGGGGVTVDVAKFRAGDRVYEYLLAVEWA
jgi:hypothetical protein